MGKIKPLKPNEVKDRKESEIPDYVIEAVNNLIVKNYREAGFTIKQKDIITEIISLSSPKITSEEIFKNDYLEFENIFRKNGWSVSYDKPGYSESYDAFFKFGPIKK